MSELKYKKGDVIEAAIQSTTPIIIPHVCNNIGGWGRGFVLALSNKWKQPEEQYKSLESYLLGNVYFVKVEPTIWVANMIGQHGIYPHRGTQPVRYQAIKKALAEVANRAKEWNAEVYAPKFGAGLAGGDWNEIEKIIKTTLVDNGVDATIYEL